MKKTVFITGASRGLGRLWMDALLKRGDQVVAAVRNSDNLADLQRAYPNHLLVLQLDVTDRKGCFVAVEKAVAHFGTVDTLINNAGYGHTAAIEELSEKDARSVFETNVFGALWVIQAVLPYMRNQAKGHIIQLSSALGVATLPTWGIYSATKFAVEGMTESLAAEVSGFGIDVTILEPNGFNTEFSTSSKAQSTSLQAYDELRKSINERQGARPEDMGNPAATVDAVIKLIDAKNPPLRFILGKAALPWFKNTYAERIKTWETWQEVSVAAHG